MSKVGLTGVMIKAGVLLAALALAFAPKVQAWSTSIHHDRAGTFHKALTESPSIPGEVKEHIDYQSIYMASTAPDDWREATGKWGTWQWNMLENAVDEFRRIRDAWAAGDYDNAVYRIGVVGHYDGDTMQMEHNENLRKWFKNYIEPLGSEAPIWSEEESGGQYYPAHIRQQVEAYTDSDSVWYPLKPENYGTLDDGSLDWFLNNYYENIMWEHIWQTDPYNYDPYVGGKTGDLQIDNRYFYWIETHDAEQSKMDADNDTRLVYNGVYRALRDGEWRKQGNSENPPSDWSYWHWPTENTWLSPRTYGNGCDSIRWWEGQTSRKYTGVVPTSFSSIAGQDLLTSPRYRLPGQEAAQGDFGAETPSISLVFLAVGLTGLTLSICRTLHSRRRW